MTGNQTIENLEKRILALEAELAEQKQALDSLQQMEESYRNVLELAPEAILISQLQDSRLIQVNDAFCQLTGYSRQEAIGRTVLELNLYPDQTAREKLIKEMRELGFVDSMEIQFQAKDGTLMDDLLSTRYIRFQGEPCVLSMATVITPLKKAQEALRRSEERYRNILEKMEEGYWEVDLEGKLTFFNDAFLRVCGNIPREFLLGLSPTDFSPPNEKERMTRIFTEVYMTGVPAEVLDFEVILFDYSRIFIEMSVALLKDSDGVPIGFHGISRDRTAQRNIEKALAESEEKYRLLIENANEGICIIQEGVIKFPNPRMEALSGYRADELARLPFLNLVHPNDRDTVQAFQQRKPDSQTQTAPFSFRMVNKENQILWIEISPITIVWEGKPATLIFLRDITPQKKMEVQFLQAQRMEAVGTLAGGIAHNFNNLLMGIQGNISLILLDMDRSHADYEKLKNVEQLVKEGAEVAKELLGLARGGKYEITPIDLNRLVALSSDLFGRTKKEIRIHKLFQESIWTVEVDRSQIEQALLNLYVNSWQAMPTGGDLYLETGNVVLDDYSVKSYGIAPGRYVRISVTDTGVGMDEETLKRIFDPFFTTKDVGRGTGLGLASVYGIIKNHGGLINVYSERGQGTTFNLYLPASDKSIPKEAELTQEILYGSGSILFVDDEAALTQVGSRLLGRLGYRVIVAGSGQEAIEIYRRERDQIDLVILDMIMPGRSGGETYDLLKEINPSVKVLLSSGYSMNGQAKEILGRGCLGFLQKPFNLSDLSKKVRQVLER